MSTMVEFWFEKQKKICNSIVEPLLEIEAVGEIDPTYRPSRSKPVYIASNHHEAQIPFQNWLPRLRLIIHPSYFYLHGPTEKQSNSCLNQTVSNMVHQNIFQLRQGHLPLYWTNDYFLIVMKRIFFITTKVEKSPNLLSGLLGARVRKNIYCTINEFGKNSRASGRRDEIFLSSRFSLKTSVSGFEDIFKK